MSNIKHISEILPKFKGGEKLFRESVLFNQVIQMMARGVDEYEVIEHIIRVCEDSNNALIEHIRRFGYSHHPLIDK